jgi:molybdate/tungstate transport system ATP-binding protein
MIAVSGLCVTAGKFRLADISFHVAAGTHAVIMGPSGAGKTTLIEAICGLRGTLSGTVVIGGRDITGLPPAARNIGFVPQDGALFPHLTVRKNAAFALEVKKWSRENVTSRVESLAGQLGLAALLDRPVQGLSGGERQRVALARALAARPPVLLLDEPLSALDSESRQTLREVLQRIRAEEGVTILHVTHDAADAESLATQLIQLPRP